MMGEETLGEISQEDNSVKCVYLEENSEVL